MTASQQPAANNAAQSTADNQNPAPYLTPYHLDEQYAAALLGPVIAELGELEARTVRFAERIKMSDDDRATMRAAGRALAAARDEIARVRPTDRA